MGVMFLGTAEHFVLAKESPSLKYGPVYVRFSLQEILVSPTPSPKCYLKSAKKEGRTFGAKTFRQQGLFPTTERMT